MHLIKCVQQLPVACDGVRRAAGLYGEVLALPKCSGRAMQLHRMLLAGRTTADSFSAALPVPFPQQLSLQQCSVKPGLCRRQQ